MTAVSEYDRPTKHMIRCFHAALAKRGIMDMKPLLVSQASDGRTEHCGELTLDEMQRLLRLASPGSQVQVSVDVEAGNRMRRRILSLCYTIGWTSYSATQRRAVVDMARLDEWMVSYSYGHKPMQDYTIDELPRLVSQFELMTKTLV
ncbi:MAG: hypothetical protein KGZ82_10730 [Bacteroidales bacterium]|nr:hypothetical protein [Bacteroidales bacterium]